MKKILSPDFFAVNNTIQIAQALLGKFLIRKIGNRETALMITEVEAYDGHEDKASHASRGQTLRTEPMFGHAGFFYVYFCYGMHWMLNIVTGPKNYPAAILMRGGVLREGSRTDMLGNKTLSGPARLTRFLQIDGKFNFKKAAPSTGLWFEDRGIIIKNTDIQCGPRIGVHYAGPVWSQKPYRFLLKNHPYNL